MPGATIKRDGTEAMDSSGWCCRDSFARLDGVLVIFGHRIGTHHGTHGNRHMHFECDGGPGATRTLFAL